jgi:23S rRNA pseudouridine955/2504/2580 synthase
MNTYQIEKLETDLRFDRWFKRHYPDVSYGGMEKLLRTGQIRVDGRRAKSNLRLSEGQHVRIPPVHILERLSFKASEEKEKRDPHHLKAQREFLNSIKLFEDDHIMAFNKPSGLAVQGGSKVQHHIDGMLASLVEDGQECPKLVHRLDKDTSGVLIVAKTSYAAAWIASAFYHKSTRKSYWAAVVGLPQESEGVMDLPLAKLPGRYGEIVTGDQETGRDALTHYRIIDNVGNKVSWLELTPITGRTHQLRAHCTYCLGTPILGDGKYGGAAAYPFQENAQMQLHLHAERITIPKLDGGMVTIVAPLPSHMVDTWELLGFQIPPTPRSREAKRSGLNKV